MGRCDAAPLREVDGGAEPLLQREAKKQRPASESGPYTGEEKSMGLKIRRYKG